MSDARSMAYVLNQLHLSNFLLVSSTILVLPSSSKFDFLEFDIGVKPIALVELAFGYFYHPYYLVLVFPV